MRGQQPDLRTWDAWRNIHQPFEILWWRDALARGHCDDTTHAAQWGPVVEFVELRGRVLDVGAGPRPPFAPCAVIDPLALEYQRLTPPEWWVGVEVHAQPAETLIEELVGRFDTVVCWNCIDHAVGWRDILRNMRDYGATDARYAVATDFHEPFVGHPGFDRAEFLSEVYELFRPIRTREPFGRQLALILERQ